MTSFPGTTDDLVFFFSFLSKWGRGRPLNEDNDDNDDNDDDNNDNDDNCSCNSSIKDIWLIIVIQPFYNHTL